MPGMTVDTNDARRGGDRAARPASGPAHHLWCFIRQWAATHALWAALAALLVAVAATARGDHHDTWIAASALGLAVLPAAVEGLTQIRVPRGFVLGVGLYVVATVILGELTDFYQRFAWWDVAMHALAGATLAAMGLAIALTLLARHDARAGATLPVAFAAFFVLGVSAAWELFEYALDARFGFSTQNASLPDTMNDMALAALSAVPILALGARHATGRRTGAFGRALDDTVRENRVPGRRF